ncbi:RNA polymerase sigma factor [Niastella vici]|uniref:RNA polymerase sigma factor n=1 Tax=Niastella vici TaxID=1703345 RepID=UPI0009BFE638|nr:RNA polymerase sigma-70 factor [Niastella vici]
MSDQPIYNERDLLQQAAAGNQDAFARIFETYRQRLYTYLLGITKAAEVAEDILVDVFMKLWIGREMLPRIESLEGFLHKVAYNKAMDFFKTTARHARLQQVYAQRLSDQAERSLEDWLIDEECRRILQNAINQLPPQRKLIYTLSREQGLTYEEIAQALHLSRNTVKSTIMAATRSISEYLQKNYPGNAALSCLLLLV